MDAILAAKVQAGVTEEAFLVKSKTQNAAAEGDGGEYEVGQVKDWSQFYEGVKEDQVSCQSLQSGLFAFLPSRNDLWHYNSAI